MIYLFIGPASVGMDFSFVGFRHVYGIPEHADVFPLRTTKYGYLISKSLYKLTNYIYIYIYMMIWTINESFTQ